MALQYTFTRLLVTRFRDCFRFYRDVMGFTPGYGTEGDTYADFQVGGVNLSLFDKAEMAHAVGAQDLLPRPVSQDHICLVFSVADVDAFCRHLEALGVLLAAPPADHPDWGIRTAHFRDPDGNLIEVNQPLSD